MVYSIVFANTNDFFHTDLGEDLIISWYDRNTIFGRSKNIIDTYQFHPHYTNAPLGFSCSPNVLRIAPANPGEKILLKSEGNYVEDIWSAIDYICLSPHFNLYVEETFLGFAPILRDMSGSGHCAEYQDALRLDDVALPQSNTCMFTISKNFIHTSISMIVSGDDVASTRALVLTGNNLDPSSLPMRYIDATDAEYQFISPAYGNGRWSNELYPEKLVIGRSSSDLYIYPMDITIDIFPAHINMKMNLVPETQWTAPPGRSCTVSPADHGTIMIQPGDVCIAGLVQV